MSKHVPLSLLALIAIAPLASADDLFTETTEVPEVLTATRLKQAPAAVPGSMTVLDRGLIEASGARDIPELMRLVPGMMVGYLKGNQSTVNYHGANVTEARRLQVLIDGRSVYRPGLATVDWSDLPIAIEDIERIEVFRGPNTVSYGANALMGVINISTRSPVDSHGTRLRYSQGQNGIRDWYASQNLRLNKGDLRLSLSGQEDDGFDHDQYGRDYRDSRRTTRINLSAVHELDASQTLEWQFGAKEGSKQRPYNYESMFIPGIANGDSDSDIAAKDYFASLRWTLELDPRHSLQLQTYAERWEREEAWSACEASIAFSPQLARLYALSPAYVDDLGYALTHGQPLPPGTSEQEALGLQIVQLLGSGQGTTPVCGDIDFNTRESRFDTELQDTLSLTDDLRLLSGIGYRHDSVDSETYFGGRQSNDILRAFTHLEWNIGKHWILQGGAMYENDRLSGDSLTPRLALNYLITPRHGLRAVYSEAVRSPDMQENNVDWRIRLDNLTPTVNGSRSAYFFATARGPANLQQEIARSREVGYNGAFSEWGLTLDIKAFNDEIHRMISEPLSVGDFRPANDNWIAFRGAEAQVDWRFSGSDRLRLSYAYVDFEASSRLDQRLTARNSGSAGWMHDWGHGWSSALFYYGADSLNLYRFERLDLRIAKRFALDHGTSLLLAGVLQQRLDDEPLTWKENLNDERRLLYFSAGLEF